VLKPLMTANPLHLVDTGIEVNDIREDTAFAARISRPQNMEMQVVGMQRLVRALLDSNKSILQELVNLAVELCGADSAALSVEQPNAPDSGCYRWIATAGACTAFHNADLPRYPSACGVSLERGGPQQFRFGQRFYDIIGITAPLVTDGIVLPWHMDDIRGTLFIMAHNRDEAFDLGDCQRMELLADFASLAIRQRRQQDAFLKQASLTRRSAMAGKPTNKATNPVQSLIDVLYLSEAGTPTTASRDISTYVPRPGDEMPSLSALAARLLSIPYPHLGH
jgi:hypothetical protein